MKKTTLVMVITLVFLVLGLSPVYSQNNPTLPADFVGTWKRDNSDNTLTITATTLKHSYYNEAIILKSIKGDRYYFCWESKPDLVPNWSKIKLVNGDLVFDPYVFPPKETWKGNWKKIAQQTTQQAQTNTTQQSQSLTPQTVTEADFDITQNKQGTITITGYKGKATQVIIPATIEGIKVTEIGNYAFYGNGNITSVTIPNSVTSIGEKAFYACTNLTSVILGNSVTSIGVEAFASCTKLTSIAIPNSVTSIGYSAFSKCASLTSVILGNGVTSIGMNVFYDCTSLASITIPNSVKSIEHHAFENCKSLTSVIIPNSVTSIGVEAFEYCTNLTSVTIPNIRKIARLS